MDNSNFRPGSTDSSRQETQARMKESASDLVNEGKKFANDLYQEGKDKVSEGVNEVEEYVQEYSDKLVKKIHANPLSAVLVAVGVGVLLSSILKK